MSEMQQSRMFSPTIGDVILRASIDGAFHVIDAIQQTRVAGPFPLQTALAYAHEHRAPHIFPQAVDMRGRITGDPVDLTRIVRLVKTVADLTDDEWRALCERVRETTHWVIDDTHRTITKVAAERAARAERHSH